MELVAIADPALPEAEVPAHPDQAAMLARHPQINAVAMCQPPRFRHDAARAALEAGLHVMLEKPPALSCGQAAELVDLAISRKLTVFAAWHSREASAVQLARDWLAGAVIQSVRIEWKEDVRRWHPGQGWIWDEGGFGVFDPGIYALSILTGILGGPVALQSAGLEVPANCATPIAASLQLTGASGFLIDAEFDWRQTGPQTRNIVCVADKGTLVLSAGGNRLVIDGVEVPVEAEAEYRRLYRRFVELASEHQTDVDLEPLRLAEEALARGKVTTVNPFDG